MKIWNSYGSEHSAKLVMIGQFKDVASAESAKELIDEIAIFISDRDRAIAISDRYPDDVLEFFRKLNIYIITPDELHQFNSDVSYRLNGSRIVVTTDELEVSGFLKLMVDKGAKVEVYSAHDYPDKVQ
jgi:hypothetical protein